MLVSDARRAANARNALKSTGPRTREGKDRSRMNSLKHGLCSEVVRVPEDHAAVSERARSFAHALKPQTTFHAWLVDEIAVLTLRIERAGRIERRLRDASSIRAEDSWDEGRRSEAEAIGLRLADRPASAVDELRRTPQGCDWLIDRWAMLARAALRNENRWSPDQRRLAFDLLGTPAELRDGDPGEVVDLDGLVVEPADDPAVAARRQVAALLARRAEVADLDEFARSMAEADLADDPSPEVRRLRRYEATLNRRLRWSVAQVAFDSPRHRANSDLILNYFAPQIEAPAEPEPIPVVEAPGPEPSPAAEVPEPAAPEAQARPAAFQDLWRFPAPPHAPFELESGERPTPDGYLDVPAILARRERKQNLAEERRMARRRGPVRLKACR